MCFFVQKLFVIQFIFVLLQMHRDCSDVVVTNRWLKTVAVQELIGKVDSINYLRRLSLQSRGKL